MSAAPPAPVRADQPGERADETRLHGRLICLFSFDIGHEIHLDDVLERIGDAASPGLERRRAAPIHLGYSTPPVRAQLGEHVVPLVTGDARALASAWLHDFGGATIRLEIPLDSPIDALPALTAALSAGNGLERVARELLRSLVARIAPAIERPGAPGPVEDYYVIQADRLDPPASIADLLARYGPTIASTLRCEAELLSPAEIAEALQTARSYYSRDLVVTDWNVAMIVDPDYHDTVAILEFLNVQLVELRFYDALLDRRIAEIERRERVRARPFPLLYRRLHRAIDELATIRIDMAAIFERIHNAIKLGGDLYLAQIYALTAKRLGLEAWERSVAHKLEVLQELYDVLVQRAATTRAEALELTIIILIAVEIVLSLIGLIG